VHGSARQIKLPLKERLDKLDLIKIRNFSAKDNLKRRLITDWKKIFAKDTSAKGLLSKT
jgi:hypothetical protein